MFICSVLFVNFHIPLNSWILSDLDKYLSIVLHHLLGFREQINKVTSFIDGSGVYGSDEKATLFLRKMSGGEFNIV